jgi:hypothetical protein
MPRRVSPSSRASETVTIRLTRHQKALLDRVVAARGVTVTDFFRAHICDGARELGVVADFDETARIRAEAPAGVDASEREARESRAPQVARSSRAPSAETETPGGGDLPTFAGLAVRFRASFADRGEGTQRELEEALRFLLDPRGVGETAFLPPDLPLAELSAERLASLRERVRTAPLRLSRKNLYLTYLRMMLHFAFKRGEIAVDVAPGAELRAIKAAEVDGPWGPMSEPPPSV